MKNKYGYEVGDYALIVVDTHHYFKRGDVVKLKSDDGSYNPYWDKVVYGEVSTDKVENGRVVDYGQIKPCNKYGWSVGGKGVVTGSSLTTNIGDIITLLVDDGTQSPFWSGGTAGFTKAALNYCKVKKLDSEEKQPEKVVQPKVVEGYKFKVDSPEQSKRLQKILFKLGYSWVYSSKGVLPFEHTEVYANIRDKRLTQSSNRAYFDSHGYQLADIDWLTKLV